MEDILIKLIVSITLSVLEFFFVIFLFNLIEPEYRIYFLISYFISVINFRTMNK